MLDGEIAVGRPGFSFDALLQRSSPGGIAREAARRGDPAIYVVFDLLADENGSRCSQTAERAGARLRNSRQHSLKRAAVYVSPATAKLTQAKSGLLKRARRSMGSSPSG